eukprot:gb/GEZN01007550.1/.p1 GENE.gb/GEZN01007550.1/~~gb/GEZN01007550.1/.p1  ORF type:complete len:413 (+),score=51.15 gb/GEZN01007550.1/:24-1241(+)
MQKEKRKQESQEQGPPIKKHMSTAVSEEKEDTAATTTTTTTMALVLETAKQLSLREIEVKEPFSDYDVGVAIRSVGICGSDVHYYTHGEIGPFKVKQPMILGHESSGVVTRVGKHVTHLKVGDRVVMEPGVPDPQSRETRMGKYNLCRKLRFWATPPYAESLLSNPAWSAGHGCLRTHVIHPASFTYKLPSHLTFDEGALVEPLAVGVYASTKAKIKPGDVAVVLGAGPIGLLTSLSALAAGCAKVYVADISQPKVALAETLAGPGKIKGLLADKDDKESICKQVLSLTNGWGADVVFECSGNAEAASYIPNMACPGGVAVLIGCPGNPVPLQVSDMQVRELRVETVFRYAHVYEKAIALLSSRQIDVRPLITNRFPFSQAKEAYDFMLNPPATTVKTVIQVATD